MQFNQDQIAAIIGSQQLEIINLRMELAAALAKLKEFEPKATETAPTLEAVK